MPDASRTRPDTPQTSLFSIEMGQMQLVVNILGSECHFQPLLVQFQLLIKQQTPETLMIKYKTEQVLLCFLPRYELGLSLRDTSFFLF